MARIIIISLTLILGTAPAWARATKVQKAAVKEALSLYPSPFTLENELSDLAWDRASEWMAVAPDKRIEVDSKNAIQTYRSYDSGSMDLSCSVKRRRIAEGTSLSAGCNINNMFASGEARRGSVMLRRFIMTGAEECLLSGERFTDAARCLLDCNEDGTACEPLPTDMVFPEVIEEEPMVVGGCTLEQITAMAASGLSKEQIQAACGEGG